MTLVLLLSHPSSAVAHKELSQAKQPRHHQAETGRKEMPHPAARGVDVREHPDSQGSYSNLGGCVNRQDHVSDPIDQSYERHPIDVWVIPCPLGSEGLKRPR